MPLNWQYNLIKLISRMLCLLPYPALLGCGKVLGWLYYRVAARDRERAIAQIQAGLHLTREQAIPIIRRLFTKVAQSFLEFLYMPALTPAKLQKYVTIENREHLEAAVNEGRGVVLLTAHFGNWEWLGAALAAAGFPMAGVARPQPSEAFNRVINEYRTMCGVEVYSRGTTEIVAAAKAVKRGKVMGFLADQDGGKNGVFVEFFGKMASTPLGAATFAKRFKAPVVPAFIIRKSTGGHHIMLQPPLHCPDTGDDRRDLVEFTKLLVKITEDMIRQYPDEWLWFQRRWRTPYRGTATDSPAVAGKTGEAG